MARREGRSRRQRAQVADRLHQVRSGGRESTAPVDPAAEAAPSTTGDPTAPSPAPSRPAPPRRSFRPTAQQYKLVGVALVAVWLALVGAVLAVSRPPAAAQQVTLPDGLQVRLLAVRYAAPYTWSYVPGDSLVHRLARRLGLGGPGAVEVSPEVPAGSVVVYVRAERSGYPPQAWLSVVDDADRTYDNDGWTRPLESGGSNWGEAATLGWVALTNFDRTAKELTFTIPLTGRGEAATFTVVGPGEGPLAPPDQTAFPLQAGDANVDLRLCGLRPVNPLEMSDLLTIERVPPPHGNLLLADLEVREKGARELPGEWSIDQIEATTDRGERLRVVQQSAGLVFLTNDREPTGYDAVKLQVVAAKRHSSAVNVKFQGLTIPAEPGQPAVWNVPAVPEPFPGCRLTAATGLVTQPGQLKITVQAATPPRSQLTLTFVQAINQAGDTLGLIGEGPELLERRDTPGGSNWTWQLNLSVPAGSEAAALALRCSSSAELARASGTLYGCRQEPVAAGEIPVLGLLAGPEQVPVPGSKAVRERIVVMQILGESGAEGSGLLPGDELLLVAGLPPLMMTRAMLRHQPGDLIEVVANRNGRRVSATVRLDGPTIAPPAAAGPEATEALGGEEPVDPAALPTVPPVTTSPREGNGSR